MPILQHIASVQQKLSHRTVNLDLRENGALNSSVPEKEPSHSEGKSALFQNLLFDW
jgi:hypothetical protein